MFTNKRKSFMVFGGALMLVLAGGLVAFTPWSQASAQVALPVVADIDTIVQSEDPGPQGKGFGHPGRPGFGPRPNRLEYLAEALGITVEQLETAMQNARAKAIDQAVEAGIITEEQAQKKEGRGGKRFPGKGRRQGRFKGAGDAIDFESLLAAELGISVEELQSAQQEAKENALDVAIESGDLTQEQVDMMQARRAVVEYFDKEAALAGALGISVDELQNAREERTPMRDLVDESGVTREDIQVAMQAAYEEAVQAALADGAITQAQADELLSKGPGFGRGKFRGRGGRGNPGDWQGYPGGPAPETTGTQV